jgi:hypothetical protein
MMRLIIQLCKHVQEVKHANSLDSTIAVALLTCYAITASAASPTRPIVRIYTHISTCPKNPPYRISQESERKGYPHITHTTPQTRLYRLRMPPKDIHDHRPTHTRKNRPPILHDPLPRLTLTEQSPTAAAALDLAHALGLHRQLGQRKAYAREDVYDDLLRHGVVDCATEDDVAAEEAGEEGVVVSLFACWG